MLFGLRGALQRCGSGQNTRRSLRPSPQVLVHCPQGEVLQARQGREGQARVLGGLELSTWQWNGLRGRLLLVSTHWTSRCLLPTTSHPSGHLVQLVLRQVAQGRRSQVLAGSGLFRLAQSVSWPELHPTVLHTAPSPQDLEHSLQFPVTHVTSTLIGSRAFRLP